MPVSAPRLSDHRCYRPPGATHAFMPGTFFIVDPRRLAFDCKRHIRWAFTSVWAGKQDFVLSSRALWFAPLPRRSR